MSDALNQHGYVSDGDMIEQIDDHTYYALARPGRLADRSWRTRARVRVLRDVTASAPDGNSETFYAGELVTMLQFGDAGRQVKRGSWWTGADIDVALILSTEDVEVLDVLDDVPPWET